MNSTPLRPNSAISRWAAGISLLLTSISLCASRIAASEAKALSAWAALRSLKWSKLELCRNLGDEVVRRRFVMSAR